MMERLTNRDNFFEVSKNEDLYSERTEAMTPPGFFWEFYEANK